MIHYCLQINKCDVTRGGRSLRPGRHHGFGWNRGECFSFIYAKLVLLLHRLIHTKDCVSARPPGRPFVHGWTVGVEVPVLSEIARCQPGVFCFCAGPEGNWMCRKMLRPGTWMVRTGAFCCSAPWFGHTWSRHMSLCPALAVQNKPHIHVPALF